MKNDAIDSLLSNLEIPKNFALGNDVVYLPNFILSCSEEFKQKVYTQNELDYCNSFDQPLLRYASTWAAKEAVYKAIKQLDNTLFGWKSIEILRAKIAGKPQVILHQHPKKFSISLTISHDEDYVWAVVLIKFEEFKILKNDHQS
jgi:holo-[acyl-carrier protein] synthase